MLKIEAQGSSVFPGTTGVGSRPEKKGTLPKGSGSQQAELWDDAEDAAYCHYSGALS